MTGPRYTPLVASLPSTVPFVGPETQERQRGRPFAARIGANESVFGPSPKAVRAMADAASEVWQYGDPENHDLKHRLADHLGVAPENIVVGEGIDGLLGYLARMLVGSGAPVVTSRGAYPTFNFHVAGFGGALHMAPYVEDREDPDSLLALARETGSGLIYFANPDNPMGTWHDAATVQAMIDRLPEDTLLILDEAYVEFAPDGTAPAIDVSDPRVIRFRTFSKAYGMAGARIGYGIAHADLIRSFDKIRNHFGVNRIAQAGALASLGDPDHVARVRTEVRTACERIARIARDNGLAPIETATNFVAIDCGGDETVSKAILAGLVEAGVFVRMPGFAPQNRCIRVSAGTSADLDVLEGELVRVLDSVRATI
ncbi:MAG: pyridoxal phosphate-dependent aminotransferase [Pseudomonadota bacterium]